MNRLFCAFIIIQWGVKAVRLCFHLQNLKLLFIRLLLHLFLSFLVLPFSPPPLHLLSQTLLFNSLAMRWLVFYVLFLTCIRIFYVVYLIFYVCNTSFLGYALDCLHLQHIVAAFLVYWFCLCTSCARQNTFFDVLYLLQGLVLLQMFLRDLTEFILFPFFLHPLLPFFFFSVYISLLYLIFSWF
jgi:hypothetical protein